jgi:hypothetical protein
LAPRINNNHLAGPVNRPNAVRYVGRFILSGN